MYLNGGSCLGPAPRAGCLRAQAWLAQRGCCPHKLGAVHVGLQGPWAPIWRPIKRLMVGIQPRVSDSVGRGWGPRSASLGNPMWCCSCSWLGDHTWRTTGLQHTSWLFKGTETNWYHFTPLYFEENPSHLMWLHRCPCTNKRGLCLVSTIETTNYTSQGRYGAQVYLLTQ